MEQDAISENSTSNPDEHPINPKLESKSSDANLSSASIEHHPSANEGLTSHHEQLSRTSDHEQLTGTSDHEKLPGTSDNEKLAQTSSHDQLSVTLDDEQLSRTSTDEQLTATSDHEHLSAIHSPSTSKTQSLLPHPELPSHSNSESDKPLFPSPDSSKYEASYKDNPGLLPFPTNRPPLLPFPPMTLPMKHQPLRPNLIHKPIQPSQKSGLLPTSQKPGLLPELQRPGIFPSSQRPGLLPTPQRPFQQSFTRPPMFNMQRSASSETSNSEDKSIPTESQITTKPKTTKADSDSTPTLSSLPPFFRYTIMQDSEEPPHKSRKNSHTTDSSNYIPQHIPNPNQSYYPYNYPYQNNGYFPYMYQPGFIPPPGYLAPPPPPPPPSAPPPLPNFAHPPPLPPDSPKIPPPLPIYPTPPSPQPIDTTSPPPSPPSLQQLYRIPPNEILSPPFQSSLFNPLTTSSPINSISSSSSLYIRPPPPPPQLVEEDKSITSFPYEQFLESSESSVSEIPLDHIPLPQ